MTPRLAGTLLVAVGLTICGGALGQVSAANAALAEKLFEDARDLMAQQRQKWFKGIYQSGCPWHSLKSCSTRPWCAFK